MELKLTTHCEKLRLPKLWRYLVTFKWGFNIRGTASDDTGRVASWTSDKEIKLQWRTMVVVMTPNYTKHIILMVHTYYQFHQPSIGITAMG